MTYLILWNRPKINLQWKKEKYKKEMTPRPQQLLQDYTYIGSRNLHFCKAFPCNIAFSRIRGSSERIWFTPKGEPRELDGAFAWLHGRTLTGTQSHKNTAVYW